MDAVWPRRMRWRRRGAWLWPTFIAATLADAVIGHALPITGDSEDAFAAGLAGLVLNVLGVLLLSRPLGALLRRRRPDLPTVVARDYVGTATVIAITALMLATGLHHHSSVMSDKRAMADAIKRAQAYIGYRAPAEFRRNLQWVSTFAIVPGSVYRTCVPSRDRRRTYCVVVDEDKPFATSVTFGGYEPNAIFSEGVN